MCMSISIMDFIYNDESMLNNECYCEKGIINKVKLKDCCSKGKKNNLKAGIKIASYINNIEGYKNYQCLCPNHMVKDCKSLKGVEAINSHSVSRNQNLSKISEKNEIYSFKAKLRNGIFSFNYQFEKETIHSASTYLGFCNFHDGNIFGNIDKGIRAANNEDIFFIRYRLLGKELKKMEIDLYNIRRLIKFILWINNNSEKKYIETYEKIRYYESKISQEYDILLKEKQYMDSCIVSDNNIFKVKNEIFSSVSVIMENDVDFLVDGSFDLFEKKIYLNLSYDNSNKSILSFYFKKEDCNNKILNFIYNICDEDILDKVYNFSLTSVSTVYSYYKVSFIDNVKGYDKKELAHILNLNRVKTHYEAEELNVFQLNIKLGIKSKIKQIIKNI